MEKRVLASDDLRDRSSSTSWISSRSFCPLFHDSLEPDDSSPLPFLLLRSKKKTTTTTGGMIEPAAMGSEVGLALQLCAMRTVGGFVKDAATESAGRAARLVESIKILEEEKRKIEAFQRELPLCMHLLGEGPLDASFSLSFHWIRFLAVLRIPVAVIDGLKKETERCGGGCFGRVLRELLPVESRVEEDGEVKVDDKMNWMSSAQLWSDNYGENDISHENHEVMICGKKRRNFS